MSLWYAHFVARFGLATVFRGACGAVVATLGFRGIRLAAYIVPSSFHLEVDTD